MSDKDIRLAGITAQCLGVQVVELNFSNSGDLRYCLGQRVFSNGRIFTSHIPKNCMGLVVELAMPGAVGHTTDLIGVWFEGATSVSWMKPKDLLHPTQDVKTIGNILITTI